MSLSAEKIPGFSTLVIDYLTAPQKLSHFFSGDFRNWENYKRIAEKVLNTHKPFNTEFIEILTEQNKSFGCGQSTV